MVQPDSPRESPRESPRSPSPTGSSGGSRSTSGSSISSRESWSSNSPVDLSVGVEENGEERGISRSPRRVNGEGERKEEEDVITLSSDSEVESGAGEEQLEITVEVEKEGIREEKEETEETNKKGEDNGASRKRSHTFGFSSSDSEEGEEVKRDIRWVKDTKKLVNSLVDRLDQFEQKLKRRKRRRRQKVEKGMNGGASSKVILAVGPNRRLEEPQQGPSKQAGSTAGEGAKASSENGVDRENLKRKLSLVTDELSVSRAEQVKRLRRNKVREQMVIEIPDYPVEFYDMKVKISQGKHTPEEWYRRFNKHSTVRNNREYSSWIQERVNKLFPKVLSIMGTTWAKITPSKGHHLQATDLIQCRLVNKHLKTSVDKMLQLETFKGSGVGVTTRICTLDGTRVQDFVKFLSRAPEATCPFPSKSLVVQDLPVDNPEALEAFRTGVNSLLQKFGGHVTRFTFVGYQSQQRFFGEAETTRGWATTCGWLKEMSNLTDFQFQLGNAEPPLALTAAEERLAQSRALHRYPLPTFSALHTLRFQRVPSVFINTVLDGSHPQIKKVSLLSPSLEEPAPNWDRYKSLQLSEFTLDIAKFSQLEPLAWIQWPLQRLSLHSAGPVSAPLTSELMYLPQIFNFVGKFKETLLHLDLNMGVASCPTHSHLRLNLLHLQTLRVCFTESRSSKNRISYDFLLPLTSLQSLDVVIAGQDNEDHFGNHTVFSVEVIQFKGYLHRLYRSNIWRLFPSLKTAKATLVSEKHGVVSLNKYNYSRYNLDVLPLQI